MTDEDTKKENVAKNSAKLFDAQQRQDYWLNTQTGVGTSYDRLRNMYQATGAALSDAELEAYYIDNDIAATVVDRVAEEGMRQGYMIEFDGSEPGDEEDIVAWAESEYNVGAHVLQARKWARLWGGSGVFIAADNGKELIEPLEEGYDVKFLRPFSKPDMDTSLWYNEDQDIFNQKFGKPAAYRTTMRTGMGGYFMADIHESRFHVMQGVLTTQQRFIENGGWGDSVLTRVLDILKRFDGSWISIMHLLTDSSVPIYKIKDFMAHLEGNNLDALVQRMALIDAQKNNMRPILLDADGESYERVQAELTDVAAVLQNTMIRMSGAARLPVSILFGQAPAGLNASPEGDLRNFYDKVDVERKEAYKPALLHIYGFLLSQKGSPTKGKIPEGLNIKFPSLWQTDPVQAATLYQMRSTADGVYIANSVLDPAEVAIARATTAEPFGFPTIDVEGRKQLLEMLRNPTAVGTGSTLSGFPGAENLPSNAVMPRGKGQEQTGAPSGTYVENEPQKAALTGAQIKLLEELAEKVAQGAIPRSAAEAIIAASYPMSPEAISAIFENIEDLYSKLSETERAELRALPFGGLNPGNDGQDSTPPGSGDAQKPEENATTEDPEDIPEAGASEDAEEEPPKEPAKK